MSELKHSTTRAIAWSAVDKTVQQFFMLVVSLTAMRLWLTPEDFGLVAPLALFTAIATLLIEGGFSFALLRKVDATERDYNTMFWFNVGLGVVFYAILFFAAPALARYNHAPELTMVARVQFLSLIFSSLGLIHSVHLLRRNDFRRIAQANMGAIALSSVAIITLSAAGFGPWALVGQTLGTTLAKTVFLWSLTRWRPRLLFHWQVVRQAWKFSSQLIAGGLANAFSINFYNAALGDYIPLGQLGFYNRANNIKDTVPNFLNHTFGGSTVVMLTRLQSEPDRYRAALRKAIRALSFLLFPATLGLFVVAEPLVEFVLTGRWLPMVPWLRMLVFSTPFIVMTTQFYHGLTMRGRADITLLFFLTNAVLVVVCLLVAIPYGLTAAVAVDVALKGFIWGCYGVASARVLGYRLRDQVRDWGPYAAISVAMAAAIWPLRYVIDHTGWLLLTQVGLGAAIYLGAAYFLGSKIFEEVRQLIRRQIDSRI